jgi:hypothetical protein
MKAITSTPLIISAMTCIALFGKKNGRFENKGDLELKNFRPNPQTNTEQMGFQCTSVL